MSTDEMREFSREFIRNWMWLASRGLAVCGMLFATGVVTGVVAGLPMLVYLLTTDGVSLPALVRDGYSLPGIVQVVQLFWFVFLFVSLVAATKASKKVSGK